MALTCSSIKKLHRCLGVSEEDENFKLAYLDSVKMHSINVINTKKLLTSRRSQNSVIQKFFFFIIANVNRLIAFRNKRHSMGPVKPKKPRTEICIEDQIGTDVWAMRNLNHNWVSDVTDDRCIYALFQIDINIWATQCWWRWLRLNG